MGWSEGKDKRNKRSIENLLNESTTERLKICQAALATSSTCGHNKIFCISSIARTKPTQKLDNQKFSVVTEGFVRDYPLNSIYISPTDQKSFRGIPLNRHL